MSGLQKNVTGQKVRVFAFGLPDHATPGVAITGDAAQITCKVDIDYAGAGALTDTNPAEVEDGYYLFDLTQAETNGDALDFYPESSTGDVQVIAVPGTIYTVPPNFSTLGVESDGDLTKCNLVATTTANSDMRGTDSALTDKDGFTLSTAGILAVWHQALTAVVTAGSVGKLLKDEITSVRMAILTDWIDGGRLDLLLDAIPTTAMRGTDSALTDKAGFSLSTAGILAIWHQAMSAVVTAGSAGKLLKDEMTTARMAVLTDWINGGRLDLLLDAIPTTAMRGTDNGALASEVTAARMATLTDWINGGRLDLLLDAIPTTAMRGTDSAATAAALATAQLDLDKITGADGATLATAQGNYAPAIPSEVLTQVNAALDTAISELAVAAPTATPTVRTGLMLLYMALRNRLDAQTSGTDALEIYRDDGTLIAQKLVTDDGSDYSEAKMTSG